MRSLIEFIYFRKKLEGLSALFFTNITPETIDAYYQILKDIDQADFERICKQLGEGWKPAGSEKFPSPKTFRDLLRSNKTASEFKRDELHDETFEGNGAYLLVIFEIFAWLDDGLVQYNHDHCHPMGLREWVDAGKPSTWCKILDHFLEGLYESQRKDPNASWETFCKGYAKNLYETRCKRLRER